MHYLIVEDDPNLRLLWRTILCDRGYQVTEADNLGAASSALSQTSYDAVILDLYLGRENGMSLIGEIEAVNPDCKVIIVTGAADVAEGKMQAGSQLVVTVHRKPVDIEDLMESCALIDSSSQRRTA
ncbi:MULTISPECIES: response regulator [unclassified Meridianimarinicoccus]|uniref:response regulator n=1 Tax=unclassified Meridianimarinicoccus TaxID=2923344 RepID=UPI00186858F8|nr:response regulator [Fluviibacterium sp. MJW13]